MPALITLDAPMRSSWDEAEAARRTTDLQLRVYTSRLLGGQRCNLCPPQRVSTVVLRP